MSNDETFDPYKVLFPIGSFAAAIGILFWILFQARGISFFPRQAHANLMYFGFLWAFIAGFLMTAVPKMTKTQAANSFEITFASFLIFLQIGVNVRNLSQLSVVLYGMQILFLLIFVVRRFLVHKKIPFEGFLFMPFAFLQALSGVSYFLWTASPRMDFFYLLAGEAFVLNLILGVGTRLIPVLSRVPNALTPDISGQLKNKNIFIVLAVLLNLGFLIQYSSDFKKVGLALCLLVVLFIALKYFKIFKRGLTTTMVGLGLKCGVLFIIAFYVITLFSPTPSLAIHHLLYIGGFVLITFMVATRVMLAHGGQNLEYEVASKRLALVGLLFILAAIFRLWAAAEISGLPLRVSIYTALLAVAVWTYKFIKVLRISSGS